MHGQSNGRSRHTNTDLPSIDGEDSCSFFVRQSADDFVDPHHVETTPAALIKSCGVLEELTTSFPNARRQCILMRFLFRQFIHLIRMCLILGILANLLSSL